MAGNSLTQASKRAVHFASAKIQSQGCREEAQGAERGDGDPDGEMLKAATSEGLSGDGLPWGQGAGLKEKLTADEVMLETSLLESEPSKQTPLFSPSQNT